MTQTARTILVIDDDLMMGELMAAIIDSADYQTLTAANGHEGLELAQSALPSAVFCDFSMPGMNGEDVVRSLRANSRTAHIPLILMSGHASSDLRNLGVNAFLQKPFCPDEVLPLLNSVLEMLPARDVATAATSARATFSVAHA
ncbi:MAG TPA: response regulator [Candidatus Acidoferrum sp.]|nr:response regulator [Candidatus Acidoferrum sp.]